MTDEPVWEDHSGHAWPRLGGSHTTDICVVGLGGSGLSAVDEALEYGASVIGIEAGTVGGEAAGRNGGFLKAGLTAPVHRAADTWGDWVVPVYRASLGEIDTIFSQASDSGWNVGSIRLATTAEEETDCEDHLRALRALGLPGEPYDGVLGVGIFFPVDGGFNPLQRCRRLADGVAARGASIFESTPAIRITAGGVETPGGHVVAKVIVVAVDGRLERLYPDLGVRTTRLQMLGTDTDPNTSIPCPVYADFGFNYWQQLPDGRLAVGGARHLHETQEWTQDRGTSPQVQDDIERVLRDQIGSAAAVTHRWSGHAAYTEDGIPVGREVDSGVWVVGAYNGVGNVLGAVYARAAVRAGLGVAAFGLPTTLTEPDQVA